MSDPIGVQKKIKSNEYHVGWEKLLDGGGAKKSYGGGFNKKSGTWKNPGGKLESEWQGKVKGGTKHTYKGE